MRTSYVLGSTLGLEGPKFHPVGEMLGTNIRADGHICGLFWLFLIVSLPVVWVIHLRGANLKLRSSSTTLLQSFRRKTCGQWCKSWQVGDELGNHKFWILLWLSCINVGGGESLTVLKNMVVPCSISRTWFIWHWDKNCRKESWLGTMDFMGFWTFQRKSLAYLQLRARDRFVSSKTT